MVADASRLEGLFAPASIAVVGAGSDPSSMGGRALAALVDHGYGGRIYPVNPRRAELQGLTCYPSLEAIPGPVDLILVLVGPDKTPQVLREAGAKGVRWAVLLNAGFAEIGGHGVALQEEIVRIAAEGGIRLVGPNCGGVISIRGDLPLGFLPAFALPSFETGPLGIVAQSGGVLTNLLNKAYDRRLGLSFGASTGNEPDLAVIDFVEFLLEDRGTRAICVYAESVKEPSRWVAAFRRALEIGKPIVLLKAGSSVAGQETAASHTGALATSPRVLTAVAERYGVTLVHDMDDLLDVGWYLASEDMTLPAPRSVVAVATSGGTAVMTADALDTAGLELPQPSEKTLARVCESLPAFGISRNPIDITAQYLNEPDLFGNMLRTLEEASEYDAIVVSLAMITTGYADRFAADIDAFRQASKIPLVVAWTGASLAEAGIVHLRQRGVPVFTRLSACGAALRARADFAVARRRLDDRTSLAADEAAPLAVSLPMTEHDAMELLGGAGLAFAPAAVVRSEDEAVAAAERLGFPVVLKLSSTAVSHKSDVGGVKVGIGDGPALRRAYAELAEIGRDLRIVTEGSPEMLVQAMITGGVEMLVGARRDPTFGWVVAVGSGGTLTELIQDAAISPVPVDQAEVDRLLDGVVASRLLGGFRGADPADREALVDYVVALSELVTRLPEQVSSVEVNPVLVTAEGAYGADALIVGAEGRPGPRP